jgi:hypothetical protein
MQNRWAVLCVFMAKWVLGMGDAVPRAAAGVRGRGDTGLPECGAIPRCIVFFGWTG